MRGVPEVNVEVYHKSTCGPTALLDTSPGAPRAVR